MDACLNAHEQALQHAQAAGSPTELARAYGGIGDAWYQRGRMLSARDHFAQCVEAARRYGLTEILAANLPMLGITHLYSGDFVLAQRFLEESLLLAQQIANLRGELIVQLGAASVLLLQGRIVESRTRAQRSIDLAVQLGARRFHAEALGALALSYAATGDNSQATALVYEALQISRDTGMTYCGPSLLGVAARASDDPAQGVELLTEGESLLARGCVSHSYFEFYSHAIEVSLKRKRPDEARRYAQAFQSYTQQEPSPWTELLIKRGLLLAAAQQNPASTLPAALQQLRAECVRMLAHSLLPSVDAALCELGIPA
jgi:tetratricopeptide (TPR) repeat protein